MRAVAVSFLLVVAAAGCVPHDGPDMAVGQDCLRCHDGSRAKRWTAAGTWTAGARVTILDAAGRTVSLRANGVGNFYTAEPLAFPLTVTVGGQTMPAGVQYGGCNSCHGAGGSADGPLMAAGQDCLGCHNGTTATLFTAAGTFTPDAVVTVTDAHGTSVGMIANQVGNFYTSAPLVFPLSSISGATAMPSPITYGGCNRCHGGPGGTVNTGPLMLPGQDCLSCHDGNQAVQFSAAGTFSAGATVSVAGYSTTANSVGNFYFYASTSPISFATARPASVNGSSMDGGTTYGGCNRCHGPGGVVTGD